MMPRRHSSAFSLLSDFDRSGSRVEAPSRESQLKASFDNGHSQGYAEGRAEAEADAELVLAEARVRFADELAEEKDRWQRECVDVLVARLESVSADIERSVEARVADLLRPWLTERLRERALRDLERAISRALSEGAKIHIEAPPEIVRHLRERLPSDAFQIGYSESLDADVRAHIEDTDIEVNISAWIAELEAAVP